MNRDELLITPVEFKIADVVKVIAITTANIVIGAPCDMTIVYIDTTGPMPNVS